MTPTPGRADLQAGAITTNPLQAEAHFIVNREDDLNNRPIKTNRSARRAGHRSADLIAQHTATSQSHSRDIRAPLATFNKILFAPIGRLTMRLSDAGIHQCQTKALYPDHRLPPWLTEDAPRDRSNRC